MSMADGGSKRKEVLEKAYKCVCGGRDETYGGPETSFAAIARLWSAYLDRDVEPKDVAVMMVLFKAGRISSGMSVLDNWVDMAGYAACGGEIDFSAKNEKKY